jgi:hypothetical protein
LRQIRFSTENFVPSGESGIPDAVLSPEDLAEVQRLAGIPQVRPVIESAAENISHTAMVRVNYMKKHNIKPGTDEWFRLWFSLPYLTGNTGMTK